MINVAIILHNNKLACRCACETFSPSCTYHLYCEIDLCYWYFKLKFELQSTGSKDDKSRGRPQPSTHCSLSVESGHYES